MTDIRDIVSKYEAVLNGLKIQAARALDQAKRKEIALKKETTQVTNLGLPMSTAVKDYIEWETNLLMIQRLRINTHAKYRDDLVEFLLKKRIADDKIRELENQLDIKEEDIDRVTGENDELINENRNLKALLEEKTKVMADLSRRKRRPGRPREAEEVGKIEKPTRNRDDDRECHDCGGSMMGRATNAVYCLPCSIKRRRAANLRARKKYDEKQAAFSEKTEKNGENGYEKTQPSNEKQGERQSYEGENGDDESSEDEKQGDITDDEDSIETEGEEKYEGEALLLGNDENEE